MTIFYETVKIYVDNIRMLVIDYKHYFVYSDVSIRVGHG